LVKSPVLQPAARARIETRAQSSTSFPRPPNTPYTICRHTEIFCAKYHPIHKLAFRARNRWPKAAAPQIGWLIQTKSEGLGSVACVADCKRLISGHCAKTGVYFSECRKDCYLTQLRRTVQLIIIDMVRASTDETAPLGATLLEMCRRRRGQGFFLQNSVTIQPCQSKKEANGQSAL
jgi:hypothetical protein